MVILMAKKPGPKPRALAALRLTGVKVFFASGELEELDRQRQHRARGEFLRAAGLGAELAAPLPAEFVTTWSESARLAACLTQINSVAAHLNLIKLTDGDLAAARALQLQVPEVAEVLAEFRASLGDAKPPRAKK